MNPLRKARLDANLSQPQLAKKAGVDRSGISELENGTRKANLVTLAKLAKALNVSIDNFLELAVPEETLSQRGKKAITARYAKQQTVLTGELAG